MANNKLIKMCLIAGILSMFSFSTAANYYFCEDSINDATEYAQEGNKYHHKARKSFKKTQKLIERDPRPIEDACEAFLEGKEYEDEAIDSFEEALESVEEVEEDCPDNYQINKFIEDMNENIEYELELLEEENMEWEKNMSFACKGF